MKSYNPGIRIKDILEKAEYDDLKELFFSNSIGKLIKDFNSELIENDRIVDTVSKLYSPNEIIKNRELRKWILVKIDDLKKNELLERVMLEERPNIITIEEIIDRPSASIINTVIEFFGGSVEISSRKEVPSVSSVVADFPLFEYQIDVVKRAAKSLSEYPFRVLLHMPTGTGKTRTSMHLICDYLKVNTDKNVIWIANSQELLEQAISTFHDAWNRLGNREVNFYRFWGNFNIVTGEIKKGSILFASFGKLYASYKKDPNSIASLGENTCIVIVDEAHQAIAPTYKFVIDSLSTKKPDTMLLGLTATPGRSWNNVDQDRELSDFFYNNKIGITDKDGLDAVEWLIQEGYLSKAHFREIEFKESYDYEDSIYMNENDYSEEYMSYLGNDTERNKFILEELQNLTKKHKRIIYFAPSVKNAEIMNKVLNAINISSFCVTSNTSKEKRKEILWFYKNKGKDDPIVLSNYGVLTTGFDAPGTSCVLIARPTMSLVLFSQMVGRAIRGPKAGGNEEAEIVTVIDTNIPGFRSVAESYKNWEDVWNV